MTIDRPGFEEECAHQGLRFGVHPHFLVASAQLRSGIKDDVVDQRFGPFGLTQQEWDANLQDEEFGISDFQSDDVKAWDMQCCIYALMALHAQRQCVAQLERLPNAVELHQALWPGDHVDAAAMQTALDQTKGAMADAFRKVLGDSVDAPAIDADGSTGGADPDVSKPVPTKGTEAFIAKSPAIMASLIADFGLKDFQAAGVLGNIGEECDGFREMQEKHPIVPGSKGGFGWAQWTGPRRVAFEAFCSTAGLSPFSDAANYGFLREELSSSQSDAVTALLKSPNISKAVRQFEATFERAKAGLEHFDRRDQWAQLALQSFRATADERPPAAVAKILDPDHFHRVVATASAGNATYWVIEQFSEAGGQVLVKQEKDLTPVILRSDASIFPLKPGLVTAEVAALLSASFKADNADPPPIVVGPVADADISERIFASAKQCDQALITRNVPNTRNGHLACAYAVNEVVRRALGKPIGGGLSTSDMGAALATKHTQLSEQELRRGLIIISPTHGGNIGHVGIVGEVATPTSSTVIYSNSSSRGIFAHDYTLKRWKAFYRDRKGLPVFFYAVKA